MHWTGHTSTQARSFTSMHASVMMARPVMALSSHCTMAPRGSVPRAPPRRTRDSPTGQRRRSALDPVDGGVRPFAEELDPRAFDARVMRRRLDEIQEVADG